MRPKGGWRLVRDQEMAHPVQLLRECPVLFNSHTNGKVGLNRDADLKKGRTWFHASGMCAVFKYNEQQFFPHKTAACITEGETYLFIQDTSLEKPRATLIPLVSQCISKRQLTPAVTKLILFVHICWDFTCRWLCMILAHFCKCWRRGRRHTAQWSLFWLGFRLTGSLWEQEECSGYAV